MRLATLTLVFLAACSSKHTATDPSAAVVTHVVDGDTIHVEIGGTTERVRLIGIDTPEIAHPPGDERPGNPAECFGDQAHRFTETLLPAGTPVRLVRDVVPRDDYGRLLAYVYARPDGTFVNLELVRLGFAQPMTIEPNDTFATTIVEAAQAAHDAGRGLWSAC